MCLYASVSVDVSRGCLALQTKLYKFNLSDWWQRKSIFLSRWSAKFRVSVAKQYLVMWYVCHRLLDFLFTYDFPLLMSLPISNLLREIYTRHFNIKSIKKYIFLWLRKLAECQNSFLASPKPPHIFMPLLLTYSSAVTRRNVKFLPFSESTSAPDPCKHTSL